MDGGEVTGKIVWVETVHMFLDIFNMNNPLINQFIFPNIIISISLNRTTEIPNMKSRTRSTSKPLIT